MNPELKERHSDVISSSLELAGLDLNPDQIFLISTIFNHIFHNDGHIEVADILTYRREYNRRVNPAYIEPPVMKNLIEEVIEVRQELKEIKEEILQFDYPEILTPEPEPTEPKPEIQLILKMVTEDIVNGTTEQIKELGLDFMSITTITINVPLTKTLKFIFDQIREHKPMFLFITPETIAYMKDKNLRWQSIYNDYHYTGVRKDS